MGALRQALAGYSPAKPNAEDQQPSQPQEAATVGQPGQILMIAPSGETAYVPQDQVAGYEAKGAEVGILMTAPDGKEKAVVPFSKQDAYQKQGATWDVSPDNDAAKAFLTQRTQQQRTDDLSRMNMNMSRAMSGQRMDNPGDQAQAEAGRKAGMISSGLTIAGGALGGVASALAAPGTVTEEVATGLLDEFGEPITREIIKQGPSILGRGFQAAAKWAAENPLKAKVILGTAGGVPAAVKIWHVLSKIENEFGK